MVAPRRNFQTTSTIRMNLFPFPSALVIHDSWHDFFNLKRVDGAVSNPRASVTGCSFVRTFESSDFLLRNESLAFTRASYPGFQLVDALVREASFGAGSLTGIYRQVLCRAMSFNDLNIYGVSLYKMSRK